MLNWNFRLCTLCAHELILQTKCAVRFLKSKQQIHNLLAIHQSVVCGCMFMAYVQDDEEKYVD